MARLNREQLNQVRKLNDVARDPKCLHTYCAGIWCEFATEASSDFLIKGTTDLEEVFLKCPPETRAEVLGIIQAIKNLAGPE